MSSTTATTCEGRPYRPASRRRSHTRASSRPISGRSSAAASGPSAGRRCRVSRATSRPSTRCSESSSRTTRCSSGGSRSPATAWRSRGCLRGSAGSATAPAPRRGSRSTSSSARARCRAPIVIGRDHLDAGSVASPYRETEAMQDGSDAIADWPILNALVNTAAGATWVSVHHGGGVGIGNSIHAGMVVVADGTDDGGGAARAGAHVGPRHGRDPPRRRRATTRRSTPPPSRAWRSPGATSRRRAACRRSSSAISPRRSRRPAPRRRCAARRSGGSTWSRTRTSSRATASSPRWGGCATSARSTATSSRWTGAVARAIPGLVDCHTHPVLRGRSRRRVRAALGRRVLRGAPRGRRRDPLDRPGDPGGDRGRAPRRGRAAPRLDARVRDDHVRGEVRLRARPRHRARAAPRGPRRRGCPDLARRARGSSRVRRRGRLPRLRARRGAPRGGRDRRGG